MVKQLQKCINSNVLKCIKEDAKLWNEFALKIMKGYHFKQSTWVSWVK